MRKTNESWGDWSGTLECEAGRRIRALEIIPGCCYEPEPGQWERNGEKGVGLGNTLEAELARLNDSIHWMMG